MYRIAVVPNQRGLVLHLDGDRPCTGGGTVTDRIGQLLSTDKARIRRVGEGAIRRYIESPVGRGLNGLHVKRIAIRIGVVGQKTGRCSNREHFTSMNAVVFIHDIRCHIASLISHPVDGNIDGCRVGSPIAIADGIAEGIAIRIAIVQ